MSNFIPPPLDSLVEENPQPAARFTPPPLDSLVDDGGAPNAGFTPPPVNQGPESPSSFFSLNPQGAGGGTNGASVDPVQPAQQAQATFVPPPLDSLVPDDGGSQPPQQGAIGGSFNGFTPPPLDSLVPDAADQQTFLDKIKERWRAGREQAVDDQTAYRAMTGEISWDQVKGELDPSKSIDAAKGDNWFSEGFLGAVQMVPAMVDGIAEGWTQGLAGGFAGAGAALIGGQAGPQLLAPEELVTVPALAAGGYAVGQMYGSSSYWYKQGAGSLYHELRKEGVPHAAAQTVSVAFGVPYAAIELSQVAKLIPGKSSVLAKTVGQAVKRRLAKLAAEQGVDYVEQIGQETGQELLQIGAEAIGEYVSGVTPDPKKAGAWDRVKSTIQQTAASMPFLMGPRAITDTVQAVKGATKDAAAVRAGGLGSVRVPVPTDATMPDAADTSRDWTQEFTEEGVSQEDSDLVAGLGSTIAGDERFASATGTSGPVGLRAVRVSDKNTTLKAFLSKFQALTGTRVVFFATDVPGMNGAMKGSDPNTLYVNAASGKPVEAIVGHEWGHFVQKTDPALYKEMRRVVARYTDNYRKRAREQKGDLYSGAKTLTAELTNNMLGDAFLDPNFWQEVRAENEPLANRLWTSFTQWIDSLINRASAWGTDSFTTDLETMRRELGKAAGVAMRSTSMNSSEQGAGEAVDFSVSFDDDLKNANAKTDARGRPVVLTEKELSKMSDENLMMRYAVMADQMLRLNVNDPVVRANTALIYNEGRTRGIFDQEKSIEAYVNNSLKVMEMTPRMGSGGGDNFRSYVTEEQAKKLTLAQFKDVKFKESIDQVPDEIADYHDMTVDDFLALSGKRQRELWEEASGDVAEESYRSIVDEPLALPESYIDTNYSVSMTVAPVRRDSLSDFKKSEMQKRATSAKFIHLQQVSNDVSEAFGVKIESRQPVIGGWVESGQVSLEVPEAVIFDTNDMDLAEEMASIIGASAPELQNAVMIWRDDDKGPDTVLKFQAKSADSALQVARDLNAAGVNGFTYDTKDRKFSLVLTGTDSDIVNKVNEFIQRHTKQGSVSARSGTQAGAGKAAFPSESDYRRNLQNARSRADLYKPGQRAAILDVVDRAERRLDRYAAALKISAKAKKILKKLARPKTSALSIENELSGRKFDNIRQLGLYLDRRFNEIYGKAGFAIGSQEGIDSASDALVYDIVNGLAGDGSGMGWHDERVQETIRELVKIHPEFASDTNALAVYIGILATTSQGYTVVENFKQASRVYEAYKKTGKIPTNFKFAKSSEPINSNLAQIQAIIDQHGLQGYADFMDSEVTGMALKDQFGKLPTGVTLKDKVRGNRVLGPKIGSFFNNLRGQFDTITMDLWYTRTMHRFLGETVVPLNSEKMQKAVSKFRSELKKDGARTYGLDINDALKDDESTVQAALTMFQRWARGENDYTEKGYFKFPDGYKIEKAARTIFSIGGMKGAPQNKSYRTYFSKVVLAAKAKLAALGLKLTEADMQAIVWYREKNLFARTGVANAAAKPADYLDAVMVERNSIDYSVDSASTPAEKRRKFIQSVKDADSILPEVSDRIEGIYAPVSNKRTVDEANSWINQNGLDKALASLLMVEAPSARDYAAGIEMMGRLQAAERYEDAATLAERMAERSTDQGRAIQALSLLSKLTAAGIEIFANRQVERAIKKSPKLERLHAEITRLKEELRQARIKMALGSVIMAKGGTGEPVQARINRLLVRNAGSLWGRYKQGAVAELSRKLIGPDRPRMVPALEAFTMRLKRNLMDQLPAPLREAAERTGSVDEAAMLGEAVRNFDKYKEVWEEAQRHVQEQFKKNPEALKALDDYFGQILARPFSEKSLGNAVRQVMDEMNTSMQEVLVQGLRDKVKTRAQLIKVIVQRSGLKDQDALELAVAILKNFNAQQQAARGAMLKQMTAMRSDRVQKSQLQKLTELNNAGALDDGRFFEALARQYGIPVWTPELSAKVQQLQREHEQAKNPSVKLAKAAQMLDAVHEMIPTDVFTKARALQNLALLLNPKTMIRNIGGNVVLFAADLSADSVSRWVIDPAVSIFTGERSRSSIEVGARLSGLAQPVRDFWNGYGFRRDTGATRAASMAEGVKTVLTLAKLASRGKYELADLNRGDAHVFSGLAGRMLENTLGVALSIPDRAFHQAAFKGSLMRQMKLAEDNGTSLVAPTAEMIDEAMVDAARAVFQDENFASKALLNIGKGLNLATTFGKSDRYGLGAVVLPFSQVPGSIVLRGAEWSPIGFIRSIYEAARPMAGGEFRQKDAVDSFTRALLGTGILTAGFFLARLGILSGLPDDDDDLNAMREASGFGKFSLNLSALKRAMLTANWWTKQPAQAGDVTVNYDWLQPMAMPVAMGAEIAHQRDLQRLDAASGKASTLSPLLRDAAAGGAAALKSLEEQPLLMGIARLGQDIGQQGAITGSAMQALRAPGMFVPTMLSQVNQLFDNQLRETRAGSPWEQAANQVISRVPGISEKYPPKYNVFGEAQQRYGYGGNSFVNVLVNPAFLRSVQTNPALREASQIYAATGDKGVLPERAPVKVQALRQSVELTNEQISQYQKIMGQLTVAAYTRLAASPRFAAAPMGAKALAAERVMTAVHTAAKLHVLAGNPDLVQEIKTLNAQKVQAQRDLMNVR